MADFHLYLIGDEILNGRRQDQHFPVILSKLKARGHRLASAHYLPDDPAVLVDAFRKSLAEGWKVISCGGIGATPDDYTRQALATALDAPLEAQPEARAILAERFGEDLYPHRIRLCEFPQGAALVPNPVNQVAGCHIREHYLLPGFPEMAWPMTDWLLDHCYENAEPAITRSIVVPDAREGALIDLMEALTRRWPGVSFSSLPSFGGLRYPSPHIDFSVTGNAAETAEAMRFLQEGLQKHGLTWQE